MKNTKSYFAVGAIVVVLFVGAAVAYSLSKREPAKDLSAFAKCLAEREVTMYGASWCSHCQNQKAMFGNAFKYVKYVECTEDIKLCTEKNIQGFPTWIFPNGTKLVGEQSLLKLATESGCA